MAIEPVGVQLLSLEGDVVELLEQRGQRIAKIVLTVPIALDVTHGALPDVHLGDHVIVRGLMAVERVREHSLDRKEDL